MDLRLSVNDLRKSFLTPAGARLEVLCGLSFEAGGGEVVAVTGASGAGKSTLLQILGGLEAADSGAVRLGEFEVAGARKDALARFRNGSVGFVFQSHRLLPDLSALENVMMPLLIRREARARAAERAGEILEGVGLAERLSHPVGHLSGGEQQRVALARALVHSPRMVLADEPTGNLDAETGAEIGSMLAAYSRRQGAVVLIATHNEALAEGCDRTLRLDGGVVEEAGGRP